MVTIDLPSQTVTAAGFTATFSIDPFVKHRLVNGLDPIALTLEHADDIDRFEALSPILEAGAHRAGRLTPRLDA